MTELETERVFPGESALHFTQSGGTLTPADWFKLTDADKTALRAAGAAVRRQQAVNIALALQGRLTAEQRYESDMAQLRDACKGAAGNGV